MISRLIRSIMEDSHLIRNISEICVVDNGSKDDIGKALEGFGLKIKYVRNEENLGFSKAVNSGALLCHGEYLLLLNSDVILPEGEILKMKEVMDTYPQIGVCGPQLIYPDGTLQRSYSHFPSILSEIVPRFLYEKFILKRTLKGLSTPFFTSPIYIVDALIGACLLIRKKTFQDLDGFDERFFFFLEETDFCLRVKRSKQLVAFIPWAKVIHLQGMTVRKYWVLGRLEYNISLLKFVKKYHSEWYVRFFIFIRFKKTLLGTIFCLLFPFLLFSQKKRRLFVYYISLLIWFLRGFPEDYGLKRLKS